MALRKILSKKEKENLIESPSLKEDIIRWYTLTESEIHYKGIPHSPLSIFLKFA
nr:hypothetical protein [Elizabethkingia sp. ASV34]